MKELNVLYQSSKQYLPVTMVSLYSLLDQCCDVDKINIYLISSDIDDDSLCMFTKLIKSFEQNFYIIPGKFIDDLLENYGIEKWHGSYTTFYKLFVLDILDIDKILYIDSDTIIEHSLYELCDFKFNNSLLGMVSSAMTNVVKEFYNTDEWYNAGVIYFNVKKWKKCKKIDLIKECITSKKRNMMTMIGDESLINVLFKDDIKKLPLKYNYESSWWLWGWNENLYKSLGFEKGKKPYYDVEEIREAKYGACINHYTALTIGRPWDKFNDNRAKKKFNFYYKKLGFTKRLDFYKGTPMKKSNFKLFFIRLFRRFMPMIYRSLYGFKLHDEAWRKSIAQVDMSEKE